MMLITKGHYGYRVFEKLENSALFRLWIRAEYYTTKTVSIMGWLVGLFLLLPLGV
jgi:hypothetical protein